MRVIAYEGVTDPRPINKRCDAVVITRDDGEPVVVAHRLADGKVLVSDFRDGEFDSLLAQLGIHRTVMPEDQSHLLLPPDRLQQLPRVL